MNQKKTKPKPKPKRGLGVPGRNQSAAKSKTPPRAIREFTAGGVVFRRAPSGIQFLMLQDPKGRWTIPKGHVEPDESLEQTALREVEEETGVKRLRIRDKLDKIHFFYRREGKLIFMTTYFYLMESIANDKLVPEDWMAGLRWFPAPEAMKLVEYRDMEKLFKLGLDKITAYDAKKAEKAARKSNAPN